MVEGKLTRVVQVTRLLLILSLFTPLPIILMKEVVIYAYTGEFLPKVHIKRGIFYRLSLRKRQGSFASSMFIIEEEN